MIYALERVASNAKVFAVMKPKADTDEQHELLDTMMRDSITHALEIGHDRSTIAAASSISLREIDAFLDPAKLPSENCLKSIRMRAKRIAEDTDHRDLMIRAAKSVGVSVGDIAEAAGLGHSTVEQIIDQS